MATESHFPRSCCDSTADTWHSRPCTVNGPTGETHCGECGFPKVACRGEHGPLQGKLGGQMPSQVGWGSETDIGYPPPDELVSLEPNTAYYMEARGGLTAQDFVLTPYDKRGNLLHDKAIKVGSFPERDLAQAPYPMVVREVAPGDWQAGIDYAYEFTVRRTPWGPNRYLVERAELDSVETDRTFENETRPL